MRSCIKNLETIHREKIPDLLCTLLSRDILERLSCLDFAKVEEIRLRVGREVSAVVAGKNIFLGGEVLSAPEMSEIFKRVCSDSVYAYRESIARGYITLEGIRIGIAGRAFCEQGRISGVFDVSSLCFRLPHRICVDVSSLAKLFFDSGRRGMLIYSPPREGKTTLLRSLAAALSSKKKYALRTVIVDTREELSFSLERERDLCLDILSGYPKREGIEIAARTLSPELIICDEIGLSDEAEAIAEALCLGVPVIASAHARDIRELLASESMKRLHTSGAFANYVGIRRTLAECRFELSVCYREDIYAYL